MKIGPLNIGVCTVTPKPCKICNSQYHQAYACKDNPKALAKFEESKKRMMEKQKAKQLVKKATMPPKSEYGSIVYNSSMGIQTKEIRNIKCEVCSEDFSTHYSTQKYCSTDCSRKAIRKTTKEKNKRASDKNKIIFNEKYGALTGKVELSCGECKQDYTRYASQVKFRGSSYCSNECKWRAVTKEKSKPQLTKALDAVFSRYIRLLYSEDGYVSCVTCGKTDEIKNMQNGHYVSRRFYSTRWDIDNCRPQCYSCNIGLAGNYASYSLFMIKEYGQDILQELIDRSKVPYTMTKIDLIDKIEHYTKIVKGMDK